VLLSASVDRATRHSADGRFPVDDTAHLRDAGIHQVRAAPATQDTPPAIAAPRGATDRPGLDERELTILSSWAEAVAEALGSDPDELAAVAADAVGTATWRADFGLPAPSPDLTAALDTLVDVAGSPDDDARSEAPHVRVVRRLVASARAGRGRGEVTPAR
jgi:hypothetical protein